MIIELPQDLTRFVEDAVLRGEYNRTEDVVVDALTRLRQVNEARSAADESAIRSGRAEPLTKRVFREHLANIGVINQPPPGTSDGPDAPPSDDHEIISDVVIRERLIEWLVSFL
jgi:Arc/MetJ-type ribon-helix-helix transcriptional regulator